MGKFDIMRYWKSFHKDHWLISNDVIRWKVPRNLRNAMQNKIINHESPPKWIFVEKKRIHGSTPTRNFNLNRIPLFREKSNCGKKLERLVICFPLYSNKLISYQGLKTNVWGSFWLHREPQEILLTAVDKSGEFWPKGRPYR